MWHRSVHDIDLGRNDNDMKLLLIKPVALQFTLHK